MKPAAEERPTVEVTREDQDDINAYALLVQRRSEQVEALAVRGRFFFNFFSLSLCYGAEFRAEYSAEFFFFFFLFSKRGGGGSVGAPATPWFWVTFLTHPNELLVGFPCVVRSFSPLSIGFDRAGGNLRSV